MARKTNDDMLMEDELAAAFLEDDATTMLEPDTMNEPDISSSPGFLGMTSDSPVMRLSFAEHEPCSTTLSEGTWSPRPSSIKIGRAHV